MIAPSLADILRRYLRVSEASWSCGSFGAIAEFARDPDETIEMSDDGLTAVTARGGIKLSLIDDIRPIAYELTGRHPDTWRARSVPTCRSMSAGRA